MTSRLKRKLNDLGVDSSSSRANESFCLIGTPLPPLEKSRDTGEFVPLWKQDVRDEKGRRRLHGAFTGGFSAGYFNTVGSKEGWTPQTFVSSRGDRAKKKAVRPEDFMDDEDLAELRDSQNLIDTHDQADLEGGSIGRIYPQTDSIASALEAALQPPPHDSPGMKILKKMGWRPGHGIGPKITYEQRKKQERHSFVAPPAAEVIASTKTLEDNDDEAKKHMYPPVNTVAPAFKRKDNSFGLGYVPGMGLSEIVAGSGKGGKTGPNIGAGFGLGALNDAEEDDLDVYDNGTRSAAASRRLAFDEDEDDERIVMGSSRNKSQYPLASIKSHTGAASIGQKSEMERYFFKDGRPVLEGFIVSEKPIIEDKWFPLPDIPNGWLPDPRRVWEQDKENLSEHDTKTSIAAPKPAKGWGKSELSASERGSMLGETPLPAAPRSVFDYLAPKDRARLKNMADGATDPPNQRSQPQRTTSSPSPARSPAAPSRASIPSLDPQAARLALQGFQPFTADPVKHARYTAFLHAQSQSSDTLPFGPFVGQSSDEFNKELSDYVRSAQVFRPVSASMAGRFQSARAVEVVGGGAEGLRTASEAEREKSGESYLTRPTLEPEDGPKHEAPLSAKDHAARSGMFGPLTREIKPWQPAKLLCKRFGVRDPNPDVSSAKDASAASGGSAPLTIAPKWETTELLAIANTGTVSSETQSGDHKASSTSSLPGGKRDISNIGLGEDETQGRDTLTYKRPAMDIFKAIFASDDEDSEDEGEKDNKREAGNGVGGEKSKVVEADRARVPVVTPPVEPSTSKAYAPPVSNGNLNNVAGTVDILSFKPTFIPRTSRQAEKEKEKEEDGKDKSRSHRKDKKKKQKTLVSFELEEDGSDSKSEEKKKKKRDKDRNEDERKRKRKGGTIEVADGVDEDEGMWVEKPPPEVVKNLDPPPIASVPGADRSFQEGPLRGRKRAIDFM